MDSTKPTESKELQFGPFLIKYWASGSGDTYVGIARIPFKNAASDWNEGFETIKIYSTAEEAERIILEDTKQRLRHYSKENKIDLDEK
ncbi:MAG: hypothetical protein ABI597_04565 [Gammaproteobacteria bacterium]